MRTLRSCALSVFGLHTHHAFLLAFVVHSAFIPPAFLHLLAFHATGLFEHRVLYSCDRVS
jgi:hypothetical protein